MKFIYSILLALVFFAWGYLSGYQRRLSQFEALRHDYVSMSKWYYERGVAAHYFVPDSNFRYGSIPWKNLPVRERSDVK